jgi:hypothetical protein
MKSLKNLMANAKYGEWHKKWEKPEDEGIMYGWIHEWDISIIRFFTVENGRKPIKSRPQLFFGLQCHSRNRAPSTPSTMFIAPRLRSKCECI